MHPELLKEIVALCKRRQAQGDHPTEPISDAEVLENAIVQLSAEMDKSERRAITFGDIVHTQVLAMRAAVVDGGLNGPEAGMAWILNTLEGPGHLPDVNAAKAEGGAQAMFNREMAEHEEFRAKHPAP